MLVDRGAHPTAGTEWTTHVRVIRAHGCAAGPSRSRSCRGHCSGSTPPPTAPAHSAVLVAIHTPPPPCFLLHRSSCCPTSTLDWRVPAGGGRGHTQRNATDRTIIVRGLPVVTSLFARLWGRRGVGGRGGGGGAGAFQRRTARGSRARWLAGRRVVIHIRRRHRVLRLLPQSDVVQRRRVPHVAIRVFFVFFIGRRTSKKTPV
ncbi:hypothetical protein F5148DRAFT_1235734, partial [Russula earlei]